MPAGKRIRGETYLHRTALPALSVPDRARVMSAAGSVNAKWNVVRVGRDDVSLLDYADFDEMPFPTLQASTLVRDDGHIVARDYSARPNPPILHRKELLVGDGHPRRAEWALLTSRLLEAGAFADPHRIGTREGWRRRLAELGIDEFGEEVR